MIYEIEFSKQAEKDMRDIFEYIAFVLLSPENAVRQFGRLETAIYKLDQMPNRFRKYEKEPWRSRGFRIMPVDNYNVYYIPDEKKGVVIIIRVMYCGRNADKVFQE